MSYDVWLEVHSGPGATVTAFDANHTSNTAVMWRSAGCDLSKFDGKPAVDLIDPLGRAIVELLDHKPVYQRMEPGNGWGSLESTIQFLVDIHEACRVHSFAVVRVSS